MCTEDRLGYVHIQDAPQLGDTDLACVREAGACRTQLSRELPLCVLRHNFNNTAVGSTQEKRILRLILLPPRQKKKQRCFVPLFPGVTRQGERSPSPPEGRRGGGRKGDARAERAIFCVILSSASVRLKPKQKQTPDCGEIQTLTGVLDLEVVHGEVAEGVLAKFDLAIRG